MDKKKKTPKSERLVPPDDWGDKGFEDDEKPSMVYMTIEDWTRFELERDEPSLDES